MCGVNDSDAYLQLRRMPPIAMDAGDPLPCGCWRAVRNENEAKLESSTVGI
jgi:hypothetical protein